MTHCEHCGKQINYLPFKCKYCGSFYCKLHRLPENHQCTFELKHTPVVPTTSRRSVLYDEKLPKLKGVRNGEPKKSQRRATDFKKPRQLKKYLERERKQRELAIKYVERSLTRRKPRAKEIPGTMILISLILIISITAIFFDYFNMARFIYFSLNGLSSFYFWIIFTGLFLIPTDGLIGALFLIIYIYFFYYMGKNIELRYGKKFLMQLFLFCTLFTGLFYSLIRLLLAFIYPIESYFLPVGLASGAMIGIISFICYPFLDKEMNFYCMFIPVKMKGRSMIYLLILLVVIQSLIYCLVYWNLEYTIYLADLGGILAAYLVYYGKFRNR